MGLSSTQSTESAASLVDLPSLGDDRGPTLLIGLFPNQSVAEFTAPLMGYPYSEMTVDSLY